MYGGFCLSVHGFRGEGKALSNGVGRFDRVELDWVLGLRCSFLSKA